MIATKKRKTNKATRMQAVNPMPKKYSAEKISGYVMIDYPKNGENIKTGHYSFRIGSSPCERVEICLNKKDWLPCRYSVGYWWFDWANFMPGIYKIKARSFDGKGKPKVSRMTTVKVG